MLNFAHCYVNDVILEKRLGITLPKQQTPRGRRGMLGRLIKALVYLAVLGFIALVAYAYLGPFFGADFSPPQTDVATPVILDAN